MAWRKKPEQTTAVVDRGTKDPPRRPSGAEDHDTEREARTEKPGPEFAGAGGVRQGGKGLMESKATVGKTIEIKGDVTGDEDLLVEGKVHGKVILNGHNLTVGKEGSITAEVQAKVVVVAGVVIGNITADDKVELAPSGSMQGDICAARVVLADGSRFKGSIDMDPQSEVRVSEAKSRASGNGATKSAPMLHVADGDEGGLASTLR